MPVKIPALQQATDVQFSDEVILHQSGVDKRISLELSDQLNWCKINQKIYEGQYQSGAVFNTENSVMFYNGTPYVVLDPADIPYTTQGNDPTAAPDAGIVVPFAEVTSSDIVLNISSVSELLNVQPTDDGFKVNVTSYHDGWASTNEAPKGGGVFVWDSSRPKAEHNGGTIIDPDRPFPSLWSDTVQQELWFDSGDVGDGCWVRFDKGFINLSFYGAIGDDSIDDTLALSKALTKPVVFADANSVYKVSSEIVSTFKHFDGNGSEIHYTGSSGSCLQHTDDCYVIHNITFRGNGQSAGSTTAVRSRDDSSNRNIIIDTVTFRDFSFAGFYLTDSFNCKVINSKFFDIGENGTDGAGIYISYSQWTNQTACTGIIYNNNYFGSCNIGIGGNGQTGQANSNLNIFEYCQYGIKGYFRRSLFNQLYFENNYIKGASVEGSGSVGDLFSYSSGDGADFKPDQYGSDGFSHYGSEANIASGAIEASNGKVTKMNANLDNIGFTPEYLEDLSLKRLRITSTDNDDLLSPYVGCDVSSRSNDIGFSFEAYSSYWGSDRGNHVDNRRPTAIMRSKHSASSIGAGRSSGSWEFITQTVGNSSEGVLSTSIPLAVNPSGISPGEDNAHSCGSSSNRWSEIFSATGTISTSDGRLKQDIDTINEKEREVAIKIKRLIRKFRYKDAVLKKGDEARIHFGVIAQDVENAFIESGLDPDHYAMFCRDVWHTYNGSIVNVNKNGMYEELTGDEENPMVIEHPAQKQERLGIRYDELLAFVISSI